MPNKKDNTGNNMSSRERSEVQPKGPGSHDVSPQAREKMAEGGRKGGESNGGNGGSSSNRGGGSSSSSSNRGGGISQGREGNQNAAGAHKVSPQGRKKMSEGGRKGGQN